MTEQSADRVHPPGADRRWRESYYFSFFDARHGIGGFSSIGKRAASGHSGSINVLWGPDRPSLLASEFDTFTTLDDHHLVAGLSYASDEPFGAWRLAFDGQLNDGGSGIEPDDAAFGPVADSKADAVDVSYDLTFTPTHPPYVYAENSAWSELFTGHVDEVGTVRGTVTVAGETLEIDGRGGKDHSWGVRNWFAPREWRWIDLVSDEGPEIAMWRADFGAGNWVGDGAVFTDEQPAITGYTDTVTTVDRIGEPGKPLPTGFRAQVRTASGSHEVVGEVVRVLPVLFTRTRDGRLERAWNDRALLRTTVDGVPGFANVEFAPHGRMTQEPLAAVLDLLVDAGRLDRADRARQWTLRQLAGGWSRHTLLLSDGPPVAGTAFVVRVKPPGALLETDLVREYRLYTELARSGVRVPTPHAVDPALDTPLGGPYFVMDWLPGAAPNVWQHRERAALEKDWADGRGLGEELVDTVARIHAMPTGALDFLGPPRTFAACVTGWQDVYERQRLVRDPVVEETFAWLLEREPDPVPPALVHGDYRIGNTMVDAGHITGVVDWELAYLGDPRYDLGYVSLDYLAGKFVKPGSELLGAVADREWFFAEYARRAGADVDREVVRTYSALGALALICILLTGIRMYTDGRTVDVRMAWNRYAVPGLRQDLIRLMQW